MKLTVFAISVLLAAILPVGWVRGQDPDSVPARGAPDRPIVLNLSGRVIDEITGQPLAGVRISIPGTGQFGVTDSSGTYHLEWGLTLYHPPYPVDATLPGYFPEQRYQRLGCHEVVVSGPEQPTCRVQLDFWMRKFDPTPSPAASCPVEGTLFVTPANRPFDGIVIIDGLESGAGTDSEGHYRIQSVPAGLFSLRAISLGVTEERRLLWVSCKSVGDPVELDFRLASLPIH